MPKKKQNKKPAKNDGKITKKKYIKTKIIGGKNIQMLTLQEKLEYLKDCLKKAVSTKDNVEIPHDYFKLYRIISNLQEDYNDDIVFKKIEFNSILHKGSSFHECLKYILLCLYDHDEYNSYILLKLNYGYKETALEKSTTKTFDSLDISYEKANELEKNALSYYFKYKNILEDFIKNIISVADAVVDAGDAVVDADSSSDDPGGAPRGTTVAPEGQGEAAPEGQREVAPEGQGGVVQVEVAPEAEGTTSPEAGQQSQFIGGFGIPFPKFTQQNAATNHEESEKLFFETYWFQIYNEGIVLLTIDDITNTKHTLKVFKSVDKVEYILDTPETIINFFNTKTEILIIRRYNSNLASTDYQWDCMIQLMYKLVNIFIKNIKDYKIAIQTQLETNLKTQGKTFLPKYKTNLLDKLIAIIFEKFPANVTDIKYGIILKSLKVIILNNKGIDDTYIDEEYTKYLKNRNIEDTNIKNIVGLSNDKPTYRFATCDNRKEYFEHIINVLYTNKEAESDETEKYKDEDVNEELEILIKLSASASPGVSLLGKTLNEDNCRITITGYITKYKSYLISEAIIGKLELLEDYKKYMITSDSNKNGEIRKDLSDNELKTIKDNAKKYRDKIENYINNKPHQIAQDFYLKVPDEMIAKFDEFLKEYEKIFKPYELKLYKIRRNKVYIDRNKLT